MKSSPRRMASVDLNAMFGESWDLVLTDRIMPGMSGDELATAIKRINPKMPIILVTAFADRPPDPERQRSPFDLGSPQAFHPRYSPRSYRPPLLNIDLSSKMRCGLFWFSSGYWLRWKWRSFRVIGPGCFRRLEQLPAVARGVVHPSRRLEPTCFVGQVSPP